MDEYERRCRLMEAYKRITEGVVGAKPGSLESDYVGVFSEMAAYVTEAVEDKGRWDVRDFVVEFNEGLQERLEKLEELGGKENE
jgi:hypothetical protein